ncbi:calcium-binding protein, partial [Kordiimonas aquimaris]|uniref:calcium-binding protein n=1 Tax=Kordiimonas aquimaris TaxID=707591 RepID=UPI002943172A
QTTFIGIEKIVGNDDHRSDTIVGTAGDDIIEGRGGDDVLSGGDGDDTFLVGIGADEDIYDGGAGNDQILATEDGTIIGLDVRFTHFAAGAVETISAGGHSGVTIELEDGGSADFSQTTFIGIEKIVGTDTFRSDTIIGTAGDDIIEGRGGNDNLSGGDGNDTLVGGAGNDQLTGGSGNDTFVFESGDGDDVITDFATTDDVLDLSSTTTDFIDLTDVTSAAIAYTQNGINGVLLDLGGGDSVFITQLTLADLDTLSIVY